MLVELSVIPVGDDERLSDRIAEILKLVDRSGLPYQLTPSGTCIEGDWEELMALVHECHQQARQHADHVFTLLKIEDEAGAEKKLVTNVSSVAEKVGKPLARV